MDLLPGTVYKKLEHGGLLPRTPVKEMGPFFEDQQQQHHHQEHQPADGWEDLGPGPGNPGRGGWYRPRGFRRGRGPQFPRPWMVRFGI